MNTSITDRLGRFLRRDQILDNELWREIYARDASYFNIRPLCVARPETREEVRRVLGVAAAAGCGVTFRTGGTSLSGQTVGEGIICEMRTGWNEYSVREAGKSVRFEPGLTVRQVNARLAPFHTHIGPDPASSAAAMMGGVLANNSSGMEAGVKYNSYHTLKSIEFMTASGHLYDTSVAADRERFMRDERELCEGLLQIRAEIMADDETRNRIIEKYKIKNVTGYAMNSFVDYSDPLDIFAHLLIGSEGTLAWIASGELTTRPLYDVYSASMLYFPDVTSAAASAAFLGETGALAVEMMDYASLRSANGLDNNMPKGTTAMLVDYGASSDEEMRELVASLEPKIRKISNIIHYDDFTTTVAQRAALWKIRDDIFPCVAGVRKPGSTVILEDVAAPVERLDRLVEGVQRLFDKYGYDGAIFGHARGGNIHPLVTSSMQSDREVSRFRGFMEDFVDHVLSLNGSLKGEHGTGRAIAPFVAREWGDKIYSLMKRVKKLADPQGILNPGVMINSDPDCFIKPIKSLDLFGADLGYEHADRCMECGYCEHVCPTRDITLTPRQRLQAQRVIAGTADASLRTRLVRQYRFIGLDSCCTDSSCSGACPLRINTGTVTDALRARTNPALFNKALTVSAKHYGGVESTLRGALRMALAVEKVVTPAPLEAITDVAHAICSQAPHWSKHFARPPKIGWQAPADPDFIYFPACVTRIFGGSSLRKDDMITTILRVADRAGIRISMPFDFHGICCSQVWLHKGDPEGQRIAANKMVETFWRVSAEGKVPIFCDTTSCTHTLLSLADEQDLFTPENRRRYDAMRIIDITVWLRDHVMPRLRVVKPKRSVALHPTCAAKLIHVDDAMRDVASLCAEKVTVPVDSHCCGAAGDRGFIYPKVAAAATRDERRDIDRLTDAGERFDGYYSLARTCEISMQTAIDRPYESIIYLVDETTAPA